MPDDADPSPANVGRTVTRLNEPSGNLRVRPWIASW